MGIHGLLPQLKSIMVPINIQDLNGQTVAVDTYSWLHKGALSCSTNLCKGIPTSKHIDYCMHRVNLLRHHGVKPVLIFDGGLLPMKGDQETKRARSRKENLERAMKHEAAGNSAAAYECYQKAVDISPSVALGLIKVLKQEKVDYIVAPYEADAQMTFLSIKKHVDAVITEDSDLIPFGCSRIIFKMDKFGQGVQFLSSMLRKNKELDFTGFTQQMLLEMCIFSGCDYLQSLPGMGLKRAHALMQKLKSYEKVIKHLRYSAVSVPPLYEENFRKAMWAFQHQRVYDPTKEEIVHLSDVPHDIGKELDFLGPWLSPSVAKGIAEGDLDPFTKLPFQVEASCSEMKFDKTYSVKETVFANGKKRLELPVQKNILTNYFCLASLEAKRKFRAPKVMPKASVTMELSSSPSPQSQQSDSPSSTEEYSPPTIHQEDSLLSKDVGNNLFSEDHLIFHKKFIAPEITPKSMATMESLSPSSEYHGSDSSSSAAVATPTLNNQQSPLPFSRDLGDLSSNDSMEGRSPNRSNKPVQVLSQATFVSSPKFCLPLESEKQHFKAFSMPNKGYATGQEKSELDGGTNNGKSLASKIIKRSSYFLHKSEGNDGSDCQNEEQLVNNNSDDVLVGPAPKAAPFRNGYQNSVLKKRKILQTHSSQKEMPWVKNLQTNPGEEEKHIPNPDNESVEGKVEGKFGCDISHLNKYSGIAEKSMDKFASLISSFRYGSSGSRASGLRRPLKDVQNTCPVRSTVRPIDFSKYAYKPKNKSV